MKQFFLILMLLASPVWAVQPDEILTDPALEARARVISKELRCVVCRNENIDSSNAEVARDLRLLVRERLTAGDNDEEVLSFVVARYGEYVLLKPPFSLSNALLWGMGPVALLLGLGIALVFIRRKPGALDGSLSQDEQQRLDELLGR
ncbi:MAG: cytochrome c-type biogenesis protein CcmH [Rhodobacteraceae bacterium]|nr:cytochrome c-type biogenesis protein CcmH [Paracoccaceae bacterium]